MRANVGIVSIIASAVAACTGAPPRIKLAGVEAGATEGEREVLVVRYREASFTRDGERFDSDDGPHFEQTCRLVEESGDRIRIADDRGPVSLLVWIDRADLGEVVTIATKLSSELGAETRGNDGIEVLPGAVPETLGPAQGGWRHASFREG